MIEAGASGAGVAARAGRLGPLVAVGALALLTGVAFWPSLAALAEVWSDPERRTYQHGYLIAAISLWLLVRGRRRLLEAAGRPAPALLAIAAIGSLAWAVAWNAGLQIVHFLLWPAVLLSAASGALGLRAGRILLPPIALLYFAMPVWEALTPFLQQATVFAVGLFAAAAGMPVLIEGTYVHIPEGSFKIAGGCSGLNYLIVGLAIAALLGELRRDRPERRLLLLALGAGFALVSNWLRVAIIIYAGHVTDMTHYLVRVDHYNFGWVLYAVVLALFFLLVRRLPESPAGPAADAPDPSSRPALGAIAVSAAIAAVLVGPILAGSMRIAGAGTLSRAEQTAVGQIALPAGLRWRESAPGGEWEPVFPGADRESLTDFSQDGERVTVYTATYFRQAQGRELIGHRSHVEGPAAGSLSRTGLRTVTGETATAVMEAEWRGASGAQALIWSAYRIGTREFPTGLPAQLWYGFSSLWSEPVSAVVALRAECRPDCAAARRLLERFAAAALPELLTAASRPEDAGA